MSLHDSKRPEPTVGMPATIHLWSDSIAAVVVKVNKKSVVVCRVETTERVKDMSRDGATDPNCPPVLVAEGIIDRPIEGATERYSRIDTPQGPRFRNGSTGITLGYSRSVTDYRV